MIVKQAPSPTASILAESQRRMMMSFGGEDYPHHESFISNTGASMFKRTGSQIKNYNTSGLGNSMNGEQINGGNRYEYQYEIVVIWK